MFKALGLMVCDATVCLDECVVVFVHVRDLKAVLVALVESKREKDCGFEPPKIHILIKSKT